MEGTIAITPELVSAYDAALGGCLVVEHDAPGWLRLHGSNALDFLHRMSTNDMNALEPGGLRGTVLTTAIGRTVDVVLVLSRPSEVLLLTSPGREAGVQEWLGRYIFFNDDVQIERGVEPLSLWGVYGPTSAAEVAMVAGPPPASPEAFSEFGDGLLWGTALPIAGFRLLAGAETSSRARGRWGEHGTGPAGAQAYEAIRVERGQPAVGREIGEDVIPLEVDLWNLVSFTKGCYIGQEVIARMESRNRVTRRLAGVRLDRLEETPQEILQAGQPIGRLTSAVVSPKLGPIGLGLVRASVLDGDRGQILLSPAGSGGTLQPLPFAGAPD